MGGGEKEKRIYRCYIRRQNKKITACLRKKIFISFNIVSLKHILSARKSSGDEMLYMFA